MSDQDFAEDDNNNAVDEFEDENQDNNNEFANILQKVQQIEQENEQLNNVIKNGKSSSNNNESKSNINTNSDEKLFNTNETQLTSNSNNNNNNNNNNDEVVVYEEENDNSNANNNNNGEDINEEKKENQEEIDKRSIFVNNVDYGTDAEELRDFFKACGTIERITIVCDKYTGRPKGCAYIQFKSEESVAIAMDLNDKEFRNRQIKVEQKRTNMPTWMISRGRGDARGGGARRRGGRRRIPMAAAVPPMAYYGMPAQPMYGPAYGYYPTRPPRGFRARKWSPY